jgi:hypothetical protein
MPFLPSTRIDPLKNPCLSVAGFLRSVLHCFDDVLVSGAAAQIALETMADLFS